MLLTLLAFLSAGVQPRSCLCPDSIGAAGGSTPLLLVATSSDAPDLLACGYSEPSSSGVVRASEFEVFSCGSETPLLQFGPLQTATLRQNSGDLEIIEVELWPFGQNWQWIEVPVWRYLVTPGKPPTVRSSLVLKPPALSARKAAAALRLYDQALASKGPPGHYEDTVGRALAAALSGDQRARLALAGMRDTLHLDGAAAEIWSKAIATYQQYARATGKLPALPGA